MTAVDTHPAEVSLFDLEDQTTTITGAELPVRVTLVEAEPTFSGLNMSFVSETAPDFDVWEAIKYEPLNLGRLRRRDHAFTWKTLMTAVHLFAPAGTPVAEADNVDLVWFETTHDLSFRTTLGQWRNLVVMHLATSEPIHVQDLSAVELPHAWTAFEELGAWLSYSDRETSQLLGLGDKTAYGWRREGHPPQARIARRLYEAHAFVRQLVGALGVQAARAALARGGADSALALIGANQVAEAEARFAHLIYDRPSEEAAPIGASQRGDEDTPRSGPAPERLPGGRRRVQARRKR